MILKNMLNFALARTHMVDCQIHTSGVVDPLILQAFSTVPRELFVPEKVQGIAYQDSELDVGNGRYLLEPATHAKLIQAARPKADDVVLDVGCATGYSSAILSPIVTTVIALESNKKQLDRAAKLWDKIGACNVVGLEGELAVGSDQHKPYNLIIMNGAVAEVPLQLLDQLSMGGRLLAIVKASEASVGRAVMVLKDDKGNLSSTELFDASASYLPGFEPKPVFCF